MKLASLCALLFVAGCASGVPNLDEADVEQSCARWCAQEHPSCAFVGAVIEPKTEPLQTCHRKYVSCVKSCPPR